MKIGLFVHPYGEEKPSGLGRAISEMVRALIEVDTENSYTLYFKNTPRTLPSIAGMWKSAVLNTKWLLFKAGNVAVTDQDLFVFFTPVIPLLFFPKKVVVVVHDLGFLILPKKTLKAWLVAGVLYVSYFISLRKADTVIAVSDATKTDVCRFFYISGKKVVVVHNGFTPLIAEAAPITCPESFFLFAGAIKERKNVERVMDAFIVFSNTHPSHHLLLVGKAESAYAQTLKEKARHAGLSDRIQFLGYVPDAELAYLYQHAQGFVFPSLLEGFGMTVLEAMSLGAPVITSDRGALAEVAGDAAVLVNPYSVSAITEGFVELADNKEKRVELIEKGYARTKEFSWAETGVGFQHVIDSVL